MIDSRRDRSKLRFGTKVADHPIARSHSHGTQLRPEHSDVRAKLVPREGLQRLTLIQIQQRFSIVTFVA